MNIKEGDKLFYIELKDTEIVEKEWVTAEKVYSDTCGLRQTKLLNGHFFYFGETTETNNPNTLVNNFMNTYIFLSTSEEDCYRGMLSFFEDKKMELSNQIKIIEKNIANVDSILAITKLL